MSETINNFKNFVIEEKERCSKLSWENRYCRIGVEYSNFIFILNDILLYINELEKPKEERDYQEFLFEWFKNLIRNKKEYYLSRYNSRYKRDISLQPIFQEFISFLDNALSYANQLEKEEFEKLRA
jgi:hypothetical protein